MHHIVRSRAWFGAIAVLTALFAGTTFHVAGARASIQIRPQNASSFCLEVEGAQDVAGQPVYLDRCASGTDNKWNEVDAFVTGTIPISTDDIPDTYSDCEAMGDCWMFKDARNPKLCLGISMSTQRAVLQVCKTDMWAPTYYWRIYVGKGQDHGFRNLYFQSSGLPWLAVGSASSFALAYVEHGTKDYWQWDIN